MTDFAPIERNALADLMPKLGPDAPTLCAGWTTRDLAAHLVVRASRFDAALGIVVPSLAAHTKRVQDQVATQDWATLVAKVRHRPWWSALADEAVNRVEYFVHHEDVRRAQPNWQPRPLSTEFTTALWSRVPAQSKLALRRTPASVRVTAPGIGDGDRRSRRTDRRADRASVGVGAVPVRPTGSQPGRAHWPGRRHRSDAARLVRNLSLTGAYHTATSR